MNIIFMGTDCNMSLQHLKAIQKRYPVAGIVQTEPMGSSMSDLKSAQRFGHLSVFARLHRIPLLCTNNSSSEETEEFLKQYNCELLCVVCGYQLLKENIICLPSKGVINAHPAKLPYYRGPNPPYWIFYNGEAEGACTIHYIDAREDAGDILKQQTFEIPFGISAEKYVEKINRLSSSLMVQAVLEIQEGTVSPIPQPKGEGLFRARRLKPEDFNIDFTQWDVRRAFHFLNGVAERGSFFPEPRKGKKIKITSFSENPCGKYGLECKNGVVHWKEVWSLRRILREILHMLKR